MPVERRRIEFSESEVIAAIRLFRIQKDPNHILTGDIANPRLGMNQDGCFFECDMVRDGTRTPYYASEQVLGAAAIYFCSRHNIPLPRKAQKRLEVSDGCLVLYVQVGQHQPTGDHVPSATVKTTTADPKESAAGGSRVVASGCSDDVNMRRFRREMTRSRL